MKKLKKMICILCAVAMVFSLAACKSGGGSGTGEPNRVKAKTIKFLHIWPEHSKEFQKIANDFMALNEDVKVEIQTCSYSDIQTVLNSQILSHSLPDIFFYWTNQIQGYIDQGVLLDLSPYTEGWMDTYVDGGKQSWGLAQRGNAYYSVPLRETASILIYNKKLFEENNLKMADNYQDFETLLASLKALSTSSNWSPIAVDGTVGGSISQFYYMMQSFETMIQEGYTDPNYKSGLVSPLTESSLEINARMLNKLKDWYAKGYFGHAEGKSNDTAIRNFKENNAAMLYANFNNLDILGDSDFELGFTTVPGPKGIDYRYINADFDGFCVAKTTKNEEAAIRFLKYLTSKDVMQYFANSTSSVVPIDIEYENESLKEIAAAINKSGSSLLNKNDVAYSTGNIQSTVVELFQRYIYGMSTDSAKDVAKKIADLHAGCVKEAGLEYKEPQKTWDGTKDYSWLEIK